MQRREDLLKVFAESFPHAAYNPGSPIITPDTVYDTFPGLSSLVDNALLACPVIIEGQTIGYHIDPKALMPLAKELQEIYYKWFISIPTLAMPRWAFNGMPGQVWTASHFEMFAVKYREELESFLSLIHSFRIGAPVEQDIYHSNRHLASDYISFVQSTRRQLSPVPPTPIIGTRHQVPQATAVANTTAITAPPPYQSRVYRPRAYLINPAALSTSRRLSEIVGANDSVMNRDKSLVAPTNRYATHPDPRVSTHFPVRLQHLQSLVDDQKELTLPKPNFDFLQDGAEVFGFKSSDKQQEAKDGLKGNTTLGQTVPPLLHQPNVEFTSGVSLGEFYFDRKLKPDIVPTWDGDADQLGDWLIQIGDLSDSGPSVYTELGQIVPLRLTGDASEWFWSLSLEQRRKAMHSWGSLRHVICEFWMNRSWLDKQKTLANRAKYRENGHSHESPVNFVIRKLKLLQLVYDYSDSQLIIEIMAATPSYWQTILKTELCADIEDFLIGVKYNEDSLTDLDSELHNVSDLDSRLKILEEDVAILEAEYSDPES